MQSARIVIGSRGSVLAGVAAAVLCLSLDPALAQVPDVGPSGPVGPVISRPSPETYTTTTIPDSSSGPTAEEPEGGPRRAIADAKDAIGLGTVDGYQRALTILWVDVFNKRDIPPQQLQRAKDLRAFARSELKRTHQAALEREQREAERQRAAEEVERKRQEAEMQRRDEEATQAIRGMLDDLASKWGATRRSGPDATGGMVFMGSDQGGDTSAKPSGGATDGFVFMGSGESVFSKGTKDSAPVIVSADPDHDRLAGEPLKDSPAALQVNRLAAAVRSEASVGEANPRTEVFLDALEVGNDWAESYRYLQEMREKFPDNLAIRDAKTFFEGMTQRIDEVSPLSMEDYFRREMGLDPTKDRDQRQAESDYKTLALVRRAQAQIRDETAGAREYEVALKLLKQARARHGENLWLRDLSNYFEGSLYSYQMELTGSNP